MESSSINMDQPEDKVAYQAMASIQGHLLKYTVTETSFVIAKIGKDNDEAPQTVFQPNNDWTNRNMTSNNDMGLETQSIKKTQAKEFYLLLHDVSKKGNVGTLLRSASAFGCSGIIVRAKKRSDIPTFGAHGADNHIPFHFVDKETDIFTYAKTQLGCYIIGIEIKSTAVSVNSDKFATIVKDHDRIAFVLGNEGIGMHAVVAANCDAFVYIPHYGAGTASLNVAVAGSIIFHRCGSVANFPERERQGEKFVVETLDVEKRRALDGVGALDRRLKREQKRSKEETVLDYSEVNNHAHEEDEAPVECQNE